MRNTSINLYCRFCDQTVNSIGVVLISVNSVFYLLFFPAVSSIIFALILKYCTVALRFIDDDLTSLFALIPFGLLLSILTFVSVFIPLYFRRADRIGRVACALTIIYIVIFILICNFSILGLEQLRGFNLTVNLGVCIGILVGVVLCYFYTRVCEKLLDEKRMVGAIDSRVKVATQL